MVTQSVSQSVRRPATPETGKRNGGVRSEPDIKHQNKKKKKLNETLLQGLMMT